MVVGRTQVRAPRRGAEVTGRESEPMTARVERVEVCILVKRLMMIWEYSECGRLVGQRIEWRTEGEGTAS